jgi:hypothetical protein
VQQNDETKLILISFEVACAVRPAARAGARVSKNFQPRNVKSFIREIKSLENVIIGMQM